MPLVEETYTEQDMKYVLRQFDPDQFEWINIAHGFKSMNVYNGDGYYWVEAEELWSLIFPDLPFWLAEEIALSEDPEAKASLNEQLNPQYQVIKTSSPPWFENFMMDLI